MVVEIYSELSRFILATLSHPSILPGTSGNILSVSTGSTDSFQYFASNYWMYPVH